MKILKMVIRGAEIVIMLTFILFSALVGWTIEKKEQLFS
jgi:hypothetical protein